MEDTANRYALPLLTLILFWKMYFLGSNYVIRVNLSLLLLLYKLRKKHLKFVF